MAGHNDRAKKFLLGQVSFSDQSKQPGKQWEKSELILVLFSINEHDCIFTKRQNLRFTGEFLAVCSRIGVCVTVQHDRQVELLAGQDTLLARHCPLTGHYFEPFLNLRPNPD